MLNIPGLGPKWNLHTSEGEVALDKAGVGAVGDQRYELNCGERDSRGIAVRGIRGELR